MQLSGLLFKLSPLVQVTIRGNSMNPILHAGQKCFVMKYLFFQPQVGDILVCKHPSTGMLLVKRIAKNNKGRFWVVGENKNESTDSRDFGWLERKAIIGKVLVK